ncbi:MAG: DUF5011 domain-containing protein [Bacteroidetes bacterium]|nr:DUF5011 domain-containing protein [Bacteroidota bacterium]MBU1717451.1 DUF5011 domain-containing protein [Bacteroidota bacterium]
MKKLLSIVALIIAGAVIFSACKKDDVTPPVITLNGSASVSHVLNATYTDAGATATDDEDGEVNVTSDATTVVNVDLVGTYTITYTASDAAGNVATETRTVEVSNASKDLAGTYSGSDVMAGTTTPYSETVSVSTVVNKRILFANYTSYMNTNVYANVTGTTIDVPSQSFTTSGGITYTTFGTGTITTIGSTTTIVVNYHVVDLSGNDDLGTFTLSK